MELKFVMKWFVGIFGFLALNMFFLWSSVAQAKPYQSNITCANVRCAGGTCLDTPSGPVCQPTLTCANTLCAKGSVCRETATGPTCVPKKRPPVTTPNYGKPSAPGSNACYTVRDYYMGQSFYKTVCPSDRVKKRRYKKRRYYRNHDHYYNRRHVHNQYCPPGHLNPVDPNPGGVCAQIYAPVCGQKRVQCVKAPCLPVTQTFSNACEARNAGYSVIKQGTCKGWRWPE